MNDQNTGATKKLGWVQQEILEWVYCRSLEADEMLPVGEVGFVSAWGVPGYRQRKTGRQMLRLSAHRTGYRYLGGRLIIQWRNPGFSRSDSAAMSRALKALERRGLIERSNTVSGHKRTTNVRLTDPGWEAARALVAKNVNNNQPC